MIPYIYSATQVSPAVIAHEMLHLFGAPDLYGCDLYDMNYGTTDDYVAYCEKTTKTKLCILHLPVTRTATNIRFLIA